MTTGADIQGLEADVNYQRDRVSLLRARLYRRGMGSSARLQELERALERAQQRLRFARTDSPDRPAAPDPRGRAAR